MRESSERLFSADKAYTMDPQRGATKLAPPADFRLFSRGALAVNAHKERHEKAFVHNVEF